MFTNIFTKIFSNVKIKTKKITPNYLFNELMQSINAQYKKLYTQHDEYKIKNKESPEDLDKQFLKNIKDEGTKNLNKLVFHIKEEYLTSVVFDYSLFKKEWNLFYNRELTPHAMWLIHTRRTFFIFGINFYFRQKKFFKMFNRILVTPGRYEHKLNVNYKNIYWGFISFWNAIKIWIFSLVIIFISFYILLLKRSSVLPQMLFFWIGLTMLLYWLISGFVFFVKKYQFSRFTSVIQRFWRRSYILFWLIESGLLLVFFYLMINSTQESFYMFDQGYMFKTHLFSWKLFLFKCILVVSLITYSYLLLLNLKWSIFNKNILNLVLLTTFLLYFVWVELYQIYWVSNFYANFSWFYDVDELAWSLEFDGRRTRILNHYVMVLFLLKFWHIVFIFGCWIFFLLRATESDNITYTLYSFNLQNFIILFLMTWLFMYPWFKHTYHWLAEISYYWFYVDTHVSFYKILVNDIYYFYHNIFLHIFSNKSNAFLLQSNFINWFIIDSLSDCNIFIKTTIKNEILQYLI